VDPDIEELKELVRRNTQLSQETHRMVRSLYRETMWARFWKFAWALVFIGAAIYAYYYAQPYIQKIEQLYTAAQTQLDHIQSLGSKIPGH